MGDDLREEDRAENCTLYREKERRRESERV